MAVSKNTIVITSKGPKGEAGAAVTVDGAAITSFSTVAVTGSDNVVADAANDTFTLTGGDNVTLTTVGSEITIDSPDTNSEYSLAVTTAGITDNVNINLLGSGGGSSSAVQLIAGTNITLTEDTDADTITIDASGGGGGSSITVIDESTTLTTGVTQFTFTGDGVTATEPVADQVTVTIPGESNSWGVINANGTSVSSNASNDTLNLTTTSGNALAINGNDAADAVTLNAYLENETAPTLGAGLDVNNYPIYTNITNGNVSVYGNGTGVVSLGSAVLNNSVNISPGLIEVRNNSTQSEIRLYEESDNNYVSLKAPTNASLSADLTFTLPSSYGTSSQFLQTDGAGGLTWATSSGSGATDLDGLSDVTVTTPTAGQVLIYDATASVFENATLTAGANVTITEADGSITIASSAGGASDLNGLTDVTITGTPAAGEILINNATSGDFENATLTEGASVVITNADASITIDACQGQELNVTTRDSVDGAVSAAGEAEGTIVKFGTGTLVAGQVYTHASGAWVAVDADAEATTKGLIGMALGTSPTTNGLLVHGVGYLSHNPGTAGDVLYVSATAGQLTGTQPSTTGQFVRVAGYCLADNKIFFSPSQDWIEIA
jgi:hypothetical protein